MHARPALVEQRAVVVGRAEGEQHELGVVRTRGRRASAASSAAIDAQNPHAGLQLTSNRPAARAGRRRSTSRPSRSGARTAGPPAPAAAPPARSRHHRAAERELRGHAVEQARSDRARGELDDVVGDDVGVGAERVARSAMSSSSDAAPSKHCHTIVPDRVEPVRDQLARRPSVAAITASPSSSTNATSARGRGTKNRSISSGVDHGGSLPAPRDARATNGSTSSTGSSPRDGRGLNAADDGRRGSSSARCNASRPPPCRSRRSSAAGPASRLGHATAARCGRRRPRTPSPRAGNGPARTGGSGRSRPPVERVERRRARTSRRRATARARRPRARSGSTRAQGVSAKRRPRRVQPALDELGPLAQHGVARAPPVSPATSVTAVHPEQPGLGMVVADGSTDG